MAFSRVDDLDLNDTIFTHGERLPSFFLVCGGAALCYLGLNVNPATATSSVPGMKKPNLPLPAPGFMRVSSVIHCSPLRSRVMMLSAALALCKLNCSSA